MLARVAIAHDYLTQRGGAEKVVLSMARAFPDAPIYTLLYDPANTYPEFADLDVRVSRLNRIRSLRTHHRAALPLLPVAASAMRIDADVTVISSSGWAHGFRSTGAKLVFCHSPARWLYLPDMYLGEHTGAVQRTGLRMLSGPLRAWDARAAHSCDRYLAVSTVIRQRIAEAYGIEAEVVPSPVNTLAAEPPSPITELDAWLGDSTDFYLCVARLLPYKNVEQVVRAFRDGNRRLVVVGRGPQAEHIRALKTSNVLMLADLSDGQMAMLYHRCRALIAASYEDFGLTPIEAGVYGKPTAALRWGGFLDTVVEGVTGVYFDSPDPASITAALAHLETTTFDPSLIKQAMERYREDRFALALRSAAEELAVAKQAGSRAGRQS